jgi:hypothetical protein
MPTIGLSHRVAAQRLTVRGAARFGVGTKKGDFSSGDWT